MKCLLLLSVAIAAYYYAASVLKDTVQGYKEGDRQNATTAQIIGFGDERCVAESNFDFSKVTVFLAHEWNGDGGNAMKMDLTEACAASVLTLTLDPVRSYKEDLEFKEEYTRNQANNAYWLYTRLNPSTHQVLVHNNFNSTINSNFEPSKTTVFLAHGWAGNGRDDFNRRLTNVFLEDDDVNVIVLDWSRLAGRPYPFAKRGTAAAGRGMGQFVNWLVTSFGLTYNRCHLIGYSLGGHLVGSAGRATGGQVGRITGLDPAGPLWSFDNNRLSRRDARYVEVIHTDKVFLGYAGRLGHADFYPNGGSNMPGCSVFGFVCSHSRVVAYMASSVKYNHLLANECANMSESNNNRCRGSLNPMGNSHINKTRWGIFRVNTGRNYPF